MRNNIFVFVNIALVESNFKLNDVFCVSTFCVET